MTNREVKYTFSVTAIFTAAIMFLLLFFVGDSEYIQNSYFLVTFFFAVVLAFPYFLLKFLFYVNSHHNRRDELHLEELPRDQDDIAHSH